MFFVAGIWRRRSTSRMGRRCAAASGHSRSAAGVEGMFCTGYPHGELRCSGSRQGAADSDYDLGHSYHRGIDFAVQSPFKISSLHSPTQPQPEKTASSVKTSPTQGRRLSAGHQQCSFWPGARASARPRDPARPREPTRMSALPSISRPSPAKMKIAGFFSTTVDKAGDKPLKRWGLFEFADSRDLALVNWGACQFTYSIVPFGELLRSLCCWGRLLQRCVRRKSRVGSRNTPAPM